MRSYSLNIAGYKIRFESSSDGPELEPAAKFLRNIIQDSSPDVLIRVHSDPFAIPNEAERVFHAPYVEEINGILIQNSPNFWSVWKSDSDLFIRTILPLSSPGKSAVLKFSLTRMEWELWVNETLGKTDPLEYPLDGLILYYLSVIHRDIMIHASGVNFYGKGYLFTGISGKGKSTISKLWENSGAKVIHDDRLILQIRDGGYRMFNTPVYNNDEPRESSLHKIFIIEHGTDNNLKTVSGASAVSLVISNCIQHNWNSEIISLLLGSVSKMCQIIPVKRLCFKPDKSVVDYILENE
jgi:hypothetical protein